MSLACGADVSIMRGTKERVQSPAVTHGPRRMHSDRSYDSVDARWQKFSRGCGSLPFFLQGFDHGRHADAEEYAILYLDDFSAREAIAVIRPRGRPARVVP